MAGFLDTLKTLFAAPGSWQIEAGSVTGVARELNEDCVRQSRQADASIAILADGVGGHNGGEVASQFVCDALLAWFASRPAARDAQAASRDLQAAITTIHNQLLAKSKQDPALAYMATTLAVLLQHKRQALLAWAGDSRIYLLRKGTLTQLSEDHSVVEDNIRLGVMSRQEAEHHPMANLITSSIGGKPRIARLGQKTLNLQTGDSLLMLSDGVSGVLSPEQILQVLQESAQGVDALLAAAQQACSTDDCSAILIKVG